MFTGIVEEVGTVRAVRRTGQATELEIGGPLVVDDAAVGDSICVNGVCLTVTRLAPDSFCADVSPETMACSALRLVRAGERVNLERAMPADGRFGGHFVTGHVDTTGVVSALRTDANAVWFAVHADQQFTRHLVQKGSVTVDGVSLTVARLGAGSFEAAVIPHTAERTTLGSRRRGDTVNLEADILGKYVEALLGASGSANSSRHTSFAQMLGAPTRGNHA
ncbi:riboflavin synthase [Propionibacterium sp.]|uniref:riboflavin synthase n=1 Tax=Propionibacterium sp. TaxID=1977903 RepID=UPI0039E809AC